MKSGNKIKMIICWSVLLFAGCGQEMEEVASLQQPGRIVFNGYETTFTHSRAATDDKYLIGQEADGQRYGTFYILQTPQTESNKRFWGEYQVESGKNGSLLPLPDKGLSWQDGRTQYFYRSISVPAKFKEVTEPGVTFSYGSEDDGHGEITFGDFRKGLEYFLAVVVGPRSIAAGQTVSMTYKHQVSKVIFEKMIHKKTSGTEITLTGDAECRIIFPNLPQKATFDLAHFRPQQGEYSENVSLNAEHSYLTFVWNREKLWNGTAEPASMMWKANPNAKEEEEGISDAMLHSFYLPPFRFWGGPDTRPENQPGFFIIEYNQKSYTGNIQGTTDWPLILAAHWINMTVTLQDGPAVGGGDGSAIAEWEVEGETETPHHRLPGIYTKEDAEKLLNALISDNEADVSLLFYREEYIDNQKVKVIRLFTNVDWSTVTDVLNIPAGYVLMGQGYNVTLGEGASITGPQEGDLYVNGKLYKDGKLVPDGE